MALCTHTPDSLEIPQPAITQASKSNHYLYHRHDLILQGYETDAGLLTAIGLE
jgi:hypothetical protein